VEEPSARYAFAMEYLANTDFEHYALSSFARPDSQSRYTQLHLEHANLLGIGPGVHSFWWYGSSQSRAHRWSNIKNIARYQSLLAQHELPLETQSLLTLDQLANEYIVLGLPSLEGLNLELLETDYGVDLFTERIDEIAWLESQALIEPIRNDRIRLTSAGKLQAIDVMSRLLIDD
jgi:oxygen-independent coproporphyrinogen-3 oxidase